VSARFPERRKLKHGFQVKVNSRYIA